MFVFVRNRARAQLQSSVALQQITFTGTGKNRYQLEVPESIAEGLDDTYELTSKRKVCCCRE